MDIPKTIKEIEFALGFEWRNSLVQAKKEINSQSHYISGKQVIEELINSRYGKTFKQMLNGIQESKLYQGSIKHGIDHNLRTSLMAGYIALKENVSEQDFRLIIESAMYHDIGRINDSEDNKHGERASPKLDTVISKESFSDEEKDLMKAMIIAHSIDDKYMQQIFQMYGIKDIARATKLTNILKDADALDRVRLAGGIDKKYLRTDTAKGLVPAAYEIYANINSIGAMQNGWCDIKEYIRKMLDDKELIHILNLFREKVPKMTDIEKKKFIEDIISKSGRKKFQEMISEKIRIGNKTFNGLEELKAFCSGNPKMWENVMTFLKLGKMKPATVVQVDQDGKVILEKDTLMHGANFDISILENIKNVGLVAPVFRTNVGDTSYGKSICAYKVAKEQRLADYYEDYDTRMVRKKTKGMTPNVMEIDGVKYYKGEEARFLPTDTRTSRIAFIINPTAAARKMVGEKLYKGEPGEYENGYEIPLGIPESFISGIMVTDKMVEDSEKMETLKKIFPDKYIAGTDGNIVWKPENVMVNQKELEKDTSRDSMFWIHKLTSGRKIKLGIKEINSVTEGLRAELTKEEDKKKENGGEEYE